MTEASAARAAMPESRDSTRRTAASPDAVLEGGTDSVAPAGLALLARLVPDLELAVAVGSDADAPVTYCWPPDAPASRGLAALAARAARSAKPLYEPKPARLAAPVPNGGPLGALAVELDGEPTEQQRRKVAAALRWGAAWMGLATRQAPASQAPDEGTMTAALAVIQEQQTLPAASITLAQALTRFASCDRVSVGIGRPGRIRVTAFSDSSQFDRRTRLLRSVEACMNEASARGAAVTVPHRPGAPQATAHANLSQDHGSVAVMSLCASLDDGHHVVATCERIRPPLFGAGVEQRTTDFLELVAPALALRRLGQRGLVATAAEGLRHHLWRGRRPLLLAALAGLGLALLAAVPGTHRLQAAATVHGSFQQHVVAPFDGYIATAHARAGDRVDEGTVLVSLQATELELAREELLREREDLDKQYRRAFSVLDRADARIISDRIAQVDARIARLDEQLARASIKAPFDGLVVAGDLQRALGSPVERGQVLFEVAPLTGYEVDLDVNERDVSQLVPGQAGRLVLTALPGTPLDIEVLRVSPVARLDGGRNVFRAVATIRDAPAGLRPGMAGIAKVTVGERSLAWNWSHRLVDWLRLRLWHWSP